MNPIIYIILVFIQVPDNSIDSYRSIVNDAFTKYRFLNLKHMYVSNKDSADLIIIPNARMYNNPEYIGYTISTIKNNKKFSGTCTILISDTANESNKITQVLIHELCHSFVGSYHNYFDEKSIMYPIYKENNGTITVFDSLYILKTFNHSDYIEYEK